LGAVRNISALPPRAGVGADIVEPPVNAITGLEYWLAHAPLTFAFWLCLEISHARHVAADRAIDVFGFDAFRTSTARNGSQHALHEVGIVLVAIGPEIEIGGHLSQPARPALSARPSDRHPRRTSRSSAIRLTYFCMKRS
jgi:hypothetical protein